MSLNRELVPEIIEVEDNYNDICEFFLISFISSIEDFDYKNPAEVVLTINGKQVAFKETVEDIYRRMKDSFNQDVEERAKELVKERTSDKIEKIEQVLSKVKESVLYSLMDDGFKNLFDDGDYWHETN